MARTHLGKWDNTNMKIVIRTIEPNSKDFVGEGELGDWRMVDGVLEIKIAKMTDPRHEILLAIHELIESLLCYERGITAEHVDEFDINFKGEGFAGDDINAPYRKEHFFAESIERLLCAELGVDWQAYGKACDSLCG